MISKEHSKADDNKSIIEAVKKAQVNKKFQAVIEFPSTTKKTKKYSKVLIVIKVKNEHDNQELVESIF